jgi:hypothetical protein
MEEVEERVMQFRDEPAIMGWALGNETWGLLKHRYSKPYLTKVRQGYIRMIEKMAQRIHEADPSRPVFSCMEHEEYQLPGELAAFHDYAPSLDVIGINSYYKPQIAQLNHVFYQFDSLRPYLVSEFGPNGYWDPDYNAAVNGMLAEDSEDEKGAWYSAQWEQYIAAYKGYNVGGVAYCWHDRMEGSNTWFGLTDYKGRVKPSYYSLRSAWTGKKEKGLPAFIIAAPGKILPGKEYVFKAVAAGAGLKGLHYEWTFSNTATFEEVRTLNYEESMSEVSVGIPTDRSEYRLYLYVSDGKGNVSTASIPIKVY